jgi:putative transposase
MLRAPRLTLAGHAHHVIQRGDSKQAHLFCHSDGTLFLADLKAELSAGTGCGGRSKRLSGGVSSGL